MKKIIICILTVLSLLMFTLFFGVGCNSNDVDTSFELKEDKFVLYEGDTRIIETTSVEKNMYSYEVSDNSIISVNADGVVSALKAGMSIVTVKTSNFSKPLMVEVLENERYIELDTKETNKVIGSKFSINAVIHEKNAITNDKVTWEVSNDCPNEIEGNVIKLSPDKVGYVVVKATYNGLQSECKIKVINVGATILNNPVLEVENCKTVKWTPILNATKYSFIVNGNWIDTTETSYTVNEVENLKKGESLLVAVRAQTDDFNYIDSDIVSIELKHHYEESAVGEPYSCTKAGTIKYTCDCGASYTVGNYIDNHDYVDGKCTVCGKIESESVEYGYDETNEVYYVAGTKTGFAEISVLAEYDDGEHGKHPVTYVVENAFRSNTDIKKVVLPSSITTLQCRAFMWASNLETLIAPGVVKFEHQFPDNPGYANNNFQFYQCFALKTVLLSGEITDFPAQVAYDQQFVLGSETIDILLNGTENNLVISTNGNVLLTYNVYLYNDDVNTIEEGFWWYYNENGEIVKNRVVHEHDLDDSGVCTQCGYIDNDDIEYVYNLSLNGYTAYELKNTKARVITLLSQYNDGQHGLLDVKGVGEELFMDNQRIQKVILPDTVTTLGPKAFYGCNSLTTVIAPGVTTFEKKAGTDNDRFQFSECESLVTVLFKNNVTVPAQVFSNSAAGMGEGIIDIVIDGTVNNTTISKDRNDGLTYKVYLYNEDTETEEENNWWYYDTTKEIVKFKVGHDHIFANGECTICGLTDQSDFEYTYNGDNTYTVSLCKNTSAKELTVLAEYNDGKHGKWPVTKTIEKLFSRNAVIEKVILPESVTALGQRTFFLCTSLKTVIAPGVKTLEKETGTDWNYFNFYGCTALTKVVLSAELTYINAQAFDGCTANSVDVFLSGTFVANPTWDTTHGSGNMGLSKNFYQYSETKSTGCWHYDENNDPVLWEE